MGRVLDFPRLRNFGLEFTSGRSKFSFLFDGGGLATYFKINSGGVCVVNIFFGLQKKSPEK